MCRCCGASAGCQVPVRSGAALAPDPVAPGTRTRHSALSIIRPCASRSFPPFLRREAASPTTRSSCWALSVCVMRSMSLSHPGRNRRPGRGGGAPFNVRSAHDFVWARVRTPYDLVVYQMGNAWCHDYMWPYLFKWPGLVVLHDAHLHHARAWSLLRRTARSGLPRGAGVQSPGAVARRGRDRPERLFGPSLLLLADAQDRRRRRRARWPCTTRVCRPTWRRSSPARQFTRSRWASPTRSRPTRRHGQSGGATGSARATWC